MVNDLLDEDGLARWLDDNVPLGRGEPLKVSIVSGGSQNELFDLQRGDVRMALRQAPKDAPPGRNATMLREHRLLQALRDTDVPHAKLLGSCEDPDVLGGAFYVMEFVDGWCPVTTKKTWPPPFDTDTDARADLAFELVEGIARLARVDWRARGLEGFGRPEGFHDRQVDRWLAHLAKFKFRDLPGLDEAAEWLRLHRPKTYEPGIMHGDYQWANVMYRHGAPATLAAIIDWEMTTIGDPLLDLAWALIAWPPEGDDMVHARYVDYTAMPPREKLLERYSSVSGRPVEDFDYYLVLARFKLAIVLEGGFARLAKGETDRPMEWFGPLVIELARKAGELAKTLP